jgi:DNA-binding transcriptional MerR regulator
LSYLLTTREAAAEIGLSRQRLGHYVRSGVLPARVGLRHRYLFDPDDIARFKRTHPTDTNPLLTKGHP